MRRFYAVWVGLICGSTVAADPPANFFDIQQGTLPIILLAPHGGNQQPSDIEAARSGLNPGDVLLNDFRTNLLTDKTATDLVGLLGGTPYVVINKIDRDYIDLNRDKTANGGAAAFEDPDAEAYYDYYHNTISDYINEILLNHGGGLLIDVHGQGAFPDLVFRGTQNGDTVTDLINTLGEPALRGPNSIFGQLETLGYDVDPENSKPLNTNPETTYVGGYTVQTYGSDNPGGIDSIQIEFGANLRFNPNGNEWEQTGADLAIAIASHYNSFIVPSPTAATVMLIAMPILAIRRRRPHR